MNILNQNDAIFLVIDVQERLLNAVFNKELVAKKTSILSAALNLLEVPVFVTEQYPQGLGATVEGIKSVLLDNAQYFEKTAFNALLNKDLESAIKASGRKQIIVCGIETHICVHQTVADLISKGFDVTVVNDACGSRTEFEYLNGIANMKANGARIKTTEMILFELLKGARHPKFKEVQALVK